MLWLYNLLSRAKCNYKLKPESLEQVRFRDKVTILSLENKLNCVWYAISNEIGSVKANARYGAYLQALGKIAGTPDMAFHWAGGSGFIEFKSKVGRLSEKQKLFRDWCELKDVDYRVARSCDEAIDILKLWGCII